MHLRSERIVTPAGVLRGVVSIDAGVISEVTPERSLSPGSPVLDLGSRWLLPGFVDLHVHGGGGAQCNTADPDEVLAVARFHASHGTTSLLATTVAAPLETLERAVATIAAVASRHVDDSAIVLGSHLEGPFLSRARPGAMDPGAFLDPDPGAVSSLTGAAAGTVRMMTLAPELPGGLALVRRLRGDGVVVSVGHSDARYREVQAAVAAGASSATHLFNAMRPFHHREPGVTGAVLDLDGVSCELICDGVHVDPVALRLAWRAKGTGGVHLVTDAMQAAGMPDGSYRLGAARVAVRAGKARLEDGDALAGSTLTMDVAVQNAVRFLGVPIVDASLMASGNPARLLGIEGRKGSIAAGMDADLVVLDDALRVCSTMVQGRWVSEGPV